MPIRQQRFSPAKINLFLHITDKRADGYHNLQTVFRLLNWGDTLDFWVTETSFYPHKPIDEHNLPIKLMCQRHLTDSLLDNLITKAAVKLITAMRADTLQTPLPHRLPVIAINLDKVIPTGAGLGGGSSNAATTLMMLNELWEFHLDDKTLMNIGAQIGADVPIFIKGVDSIAEGIGDILTPINLSPCHYLLLTPDAHINTAQLFAHPKLCRKVAKLDIKRIHQDKPLFDYQQRAPYHNVFEPVVSALSAPVYDALMYLSALEPITHSSARMTGSGSCVLLPYQDAHYLQLQALCTDAPCPAYFVSSL